jgi:hypothetical protein
MKITKLSEKKYFLDVAIVAFNRQWRKRETLSGTERAARERWYEIRRELQETAKREEDRQSQKSGTFGHILEAYKTDRERANRLGTMESMVNRLIRDCGGYPAARIGELFLSYLDTLNAEISEATDKKLSNATKNRAIAVAKAACNFGYRQDMLQRDPLKAIQLYKETPRDRILSKTDIIKLALVKFFSQFDQSIFEEK